MKFFRGLKIQSKLIVIYCVVLLPLIAGEMLTIRSFSATLRNSAELELKNIVNHLYHLTDMQARFSRNESTGREQTTEPSRNDINYLKEVFDGFTIGHTGYPYIMNSKGVLIIHPARAGDNIYTTRDSKGLKFIKEICTKAVKLGDGEIGTIRYPWKNPDEGVYAPRMKILKFRYFPKWDWIIAVGSYEAEIYKQLGQVKASTTGILILSIILGLIMIVTTSRIIADPVIKLSKAAVRMAGGNRLQRMSVKSRGDEISRLDRSFNSMADQIRKKTENLEQVVYDRTEELRESRETYRSLVEGMIDGIVTTDMSGTITFVNSGMEKILDEKRDDICGKKIFKYYTKGIHQAREIMQLLRRDTNLAHYEIEILTADKRAIPMRTSNNLLYDTLGNERGTLGIFTDITQEKKLQKELTQAQAHLAHIMKMQALGDLVAGVAHEINNPLMAAGTMLHVMSKNEFFDEEKNRKKLDLIKNCHERISKIVNHLREFSRATDLERTEININTPLENALMIMGQQLLNMGMSIEKQMTEDLPVIYGDPNYLEQVFMNIIGNARDAMENIEGDKILTAKSFNCKYKNQKAVGVAISDTGGGIPKEVEDKIFEPFFTTKEIGKGTGLGLSICFGIIKEHNGTIELETKKEQGTTFIIIIPAKAEHINPV